MAARSGELLDVELGELMLIGGGEDERDLQWALPPPGLPTPQALSPSLPLRQDPPARPSTESACATASQEEAATNLPLSTSPPGTQVGNGGGEVDLRKEANGEAPGRRIRGRGGRG